MASTLAVPASADQGAYASVNGLKMYYEIRGEGRPLVLLQGGVCKVVVFGTSYSNDGLIPGLLENFKTLKAEAIPQQFRDAYAKTAPDPKRWPTLVAKIKNLVLEAKDLRPEEMRSIKAPTMIMIGDADIVRPEHAVEAFRQLPHGQLAVLPVSDHFAPMQRSAWIVSMTRAFLNAPMPKPKERK